MQQYNQQKSQTSSHSSQPETWMESGEQLS